MSSDSGSSSGESPKELQRKRKHKKHDKPKKSKKLKKEKRRHKEKKRSKREEKERALPLEDTQQKQSLPLEETGHAFGPALPPHFIKTQPVALIGPVMPQTIAPPLSVDDKDQELVDTFGPLPHASHEELEERALALKLAVLEGGGLSSSHIEQDQREEWMLELPEVGLKGGLAALNNMKRTFYQGKERPDFSDRSSWTKTPQSEAAALAAGPKACSSQDLEKLAQLKYEQQRDEEQEQLARKHKKKHKQDLSLVELHQKKLLKAQKAREKELAASGSKPERRPFTRDVDLKMNKIDKNQTKQIVDKAKILNTKFSSGQAKYL